MNTETEKKCTICGKTIAYNHYAICASCESELEDFKEEIMKGKTLKDIDDDEPYYVMECSMCGVETRHRECGMCVRCEQVWNG